MCNKLCAFAAELADTNKQVARSRAANTVREASCYSKTHHELASKLKVVRSRSWTPSGSRPDYVRCRHLLASPPCGRLRNRARYPSVSLSLSPDAPLHFQPALLRTQAQVQASDDTKTSATKGRQQHWRCHHCNSIETQFSTSFHLSCFTRPIHRFQTSHSTQHTVLTRCRHDPGQNPNPNPHHYNTRIISISNA